MTQEQKRMRIPIHAEGWRFIIPPLVAAVVCIPFGLPKIGIALLLLAVSCATFFRDPYREISHEPGLLLSPADGKIMCIEEVELETIDGKQERLRRVGIFLSVFNTHIQRAPTYGKVISVTHTPGKYLNAMKQEASVVNENNMIWMQSPNLGTIGVKQIAGLIARRVVCKVRTNDNISIGQQLGLIRFGSQTDAYFSLDADVRVEIGQNVKAGLSVIAFAKESPIQANTE